MFRNYLDIYRISIPVVYNHFHYCRRYGAFISFLTRKGFFKVDCKDPQDGSGSPVCGSYVIFFSLHVIQIVTFYCCCFSS